MSGVRRQLATFFAVLAVLYAIGFATGQLIETEDRDDGPPAHAAPVSEAADDSHD